MPKARTWSTLAVAVLLIAQGALMVTTLHRESLTFDEGDHMYAGYRMWKAGDYGLNPEHPPLVKLLATLPVLGDSLWQPPLKGIFFKGEAYLAGRDWLEHNDGGSQRLVFRMRLAAALLPIALSLVIFFATREWFGTTAGLFALTVAVFDPNLLAHSGLVTTDVGASLFFLAAIYAFYRYIQRPTLLRLITAGVATGLLLSTKHSGVLIAPTLLLLALWEIAFAPSGTRSRLALRLTGALTAIAAFAVLVLWSLYGFRYAARPAGLQLIPPLAGYSQSLTGFAKTSIDWAAHWHLLPESYLMGMVDIRVSASSFNTYALGKWYPHGIWWYFPVVFVIKTTLGLLALLALSVYAVITAKRSNELNSIPGPGVNPLRPLVYMLTFGAVYLAAAIVNGLNIGVRHILPLYVLAAILAGAGAAALASRSRIWLWVCLALVAAHIASSLSVFPDTLAYANEAWGGARNVHNVLNDSNVDWGRQLYQVKDWEDRHPSENCWFAYTARPFIHPETYGIHCHILPNGLGGSGPELVPPVVHGTVLLSAAEVDGSIWPSQETNPYTSFRTRRPDEEIDYGVLVYRGDVPMQGASGSSRAFLSHDKLEAHLPQEAYDLGKEAVQISPTGLFEQWALGDAAAALGKKEEATAAYRAALLATQRLEPERQAEFAKEIQASLKKLQ